MFKFFLKSLIIFSLFYSVSHAGTGAATEYKVTMTKLELCETGSATDNCLNPVTISPSSDSGAVDIAAVDAGVAAASYGNLNTATVGTTYTYMQITMSRAMTITGGDGTCVTKSGASGSVSASAVGQAAAAGADSTTLYVPVSSTLGDHINGADDSLGASVTADGNIDNNDTHFQFRQVLSKPATLKAGQIPNVTIAFDVSNAVGAAETTCTNAIMYAAEPSITITLD